MSEADDNTGGKKEEAATTRVHRDNADAIVPPAVTRTTPGRVVGGGQMMLHSREAHRLFYGRRKKEEESLYPIVGLARFASQTAQIWSASILNDPFADWVLIDVEDRFDKVEKNLSRKIEAFKDLLCGQENLTYDIQHSVSPVAFEINFHTPYGFKGAHTLMSFDHFMRYALTARHVALLTNDDWTENVQMIARSIRGTFNMVNTWRHTGATRHDFAANNAIARRAIETYQSDINRTHRSPDIPEDILTGTRRPKFGPTIRDRQIVEEPDGDIQNLESDKDETILS